MKPLFITLAGLLSVKGNDPKRYCAVDIRKLTCYKDGNGSQHLVKLFHLDNKSPGQAVS